MVSTTVSITESITVTMEKKNKKIILLVSLLLISIGILTFFIASNLQKKNQDQMDEIGKDLSLEADENTPQSVFEKIDESIEAEKESKELEESRALAKKESSLESEEESSSEDIQESSESVIQESSESEIQETESSEEQQPSTEEASQPSESAAKQDKEEAVNVGNAASPDERVIDFAGLQSKKNADIYAWISVPGTNIDYPVLRHPTDDGYYLYHNLNGSSGYPGCIYTENWNSKDWTDPVTVLYGHDMRSTGTMFHQLHKFEKQNFFDKNQYIYIYTPEKTLKYLIFATYVHTNEHLLYNHNFSNKDEFNSFFNTVLASAGGVNHVREGVEISSDSKIITLSTCIKNQPNNRYLVFGVLQ